VQRRRPRLDDRHAAEPGLDDTGDDGAILRAHDGHRAHDDP
jgi:hypothetical protein